MMTQASQASILLPHRQAGTLARLLGFILVLEGRVSQISAIHHTHHIVEPKKDY